MTDADAEPAAAPSAAAPQDSAQTDDLIVGCATGEWVKIAVLIYLATDAAKAANIDAPPQVIATRIYALTENGRLASRGNVRRWRQGEVKKGD